MSHGWTHKDECQSAETQIDILWPGCIISQSMPNSPGKKCFKVVRSSSPVQGIQDSMLFVCLFVSLTPHDMFSTLTFEIISVSQEALSHATKNPALICVFSSRTYPDPSFVLLEGSSPLKAIPWAPTCYFPFLKFGSCFPVYALSCILTCEDYPSIFIVLKGSLANHSRQRGKLHLRFIHPDEKAEFKKKPVAQSPQLDAKTPDGLEFV